jgi:hypothetical protein
MKHGFVEAIAASPTGTALKRVESDGRGGPGYHAAGQVQAAALRQSPRPARGPGVENEQLPPTAGTTLNLIITEGAVGHG